MTNTARINQRNLSALKKLKVPSPVERGIRLLNIAYQVNPHSFNTDYIKAMQDNRDLDVWLFGRMSQ